MEDKLYNLYLSMWANRTSTTLKPINIKNAAIQAKQVWDDNFAKAKTNDIEFDKVWTEVLGDAHKLRDIVLTSTDDSYFLATIRPKVIK